MSGVRSPLAAVVLTLLSLQLGSQSLAMTGETVYRNTSPGVRYVGSRTCGTCHSGIAASYSRTAMGRSMSLGKDVSTLTQAPVPFTVFDNETGDYFEASRDQGALVQTQYALDHNGKEIFRQTWQLTYVIGSGENGVGFLIQRGGYLFEAPLSYYTKSRTWSFSPGYERHNYAFTRPVIAECTGCHSGRSQPVYGFRGMYKNPPFTELAVGCEDCHGPGELHVAERRAARPLIRGVDDSIVNPRRLPGWLSDNICMKCHQGGDVRVEQPGKHEQDFRPGTRLDNVLGIFKAPRRSAGSSHSVLLEHYFSMTLSKCYRAGGNFHCTTCHDPHVKLTGPQAATYYRTRCLSCHQSRSCGLPVSERQKTNPPDDCASCHMPKRAVATIAQAVLTEHRVTVTAEAPFPEEDFASSVQPESGLIHLTAQPGTNSPNITLFKAYATLVHNRHEEFRSRMNITLDRLSGTSPDDPAVLSALARRAAAKGTPEAFELSISYFTRAIEAGSTEHETFLLLADLYRRAQRNSKAVAVLTKGMETNPYSPELAEALAAQYIQMGKYRSGADIIRRGLQLFPDDAALRLLADKIQSASPDGIIGDNPH